MKDTMFLENTVLHYSIGELRPPFREVGSKVSFWQETEQLKQLHMQILSLRTCLRLRSGILSFLSLLQSS